MNRRAILWRHGRTAWNAEARFQGQLDIPLDDVGEAQAREAASWLAEHRPTVIVSSDLDRASRTAHALADRTGLAVSHDERLREANAGDWQGLTHDEITRRDGVLLSRWRVEPDVRPGGTGETRAEVGVRVAGAIQWHMDRAAAGDTVVFVTHGGAARAAVGHLLGLGLIEWQRLAVLRNCAWAVLDLGEDDSWRLDTYNAGLQNVGVAQPRGVAAEGIV